MKKDVIYIILIFLAGIAVGSLVSYNKTESTIKSDTVIITNTITIDNPVVRDSLIVRYQRVSVPKYKDSLRIDTLLLHDSIEVEVPITQKHYSDSTYDAWVSGFMPSLDSLKVYNQYQKVILRDKPKKLSIGIQGGIGITPKSVQPYIGIGVSYNLYSF